MITDLFGERSPETHCLRYAQVTTVSPRTCRDVVDLSRTSARQPDFVQSFVNLRETAKRNISEDNILVHSDADQSISCVSRNSRQTPHLIPSEIALCDFHRYDSVPGLLLLSNIGVQPALILGIGVSIRTQHWQQIASAK